MIDSTKQQPITEMREPNRLIDETSTYLRQHAYNPVEWYPWGEEAISKARAEDKPILLSIGYSACHWCHVMEHESFEDEDTAELMNRLFVNIKVDREERTDLDEIYMKAVQMLTGHGGWPMTVFLTPDLKPFFAGTYFPPQDRHGMPSFRRVMLGVEAAWTTQREDVEESSTDITKHLSLMDKLQADTEVTLTTELIDDAVSRLIKVFDRTWGGFGGAPKFPHTASISLGVRRLKPGAKEKTGREFECLEMIQTTLDKMAEGGIHDHLAGGFARYSVDRKWLVPHFEKMLYDNALLVRNYFEGYLVTGRTWWREVAKDILHFVERELLMPEGGFYCSLDADSEGEEGKFYVWTPAEVIEVLGAEDGGWFNRAFGVTEGGNFEHGKSILNFATAPEELASQLGLSEEDFWKRLNPLKVKLRETREHRIRPGRDEKMLTSWTSLMISGFVDGYRFTREQRYLDIATRAADFILDKLYVNGRLLRSYGRGHAKLNGYLDDYACFIQALLDLSSVDSNPKWIEHALKLNQVVLSSFLDTTDGGFFFTSSDHEQLITRSKHFYDGSTPSATSVSVFNLVRLARITGNEEFAVIAERVFTIFAPYFAKAPDQFSNLLCAMDFHLSAGTEIVLIVSSESDDWKELLQVVNESWLRGAVVVVMDNNKLPSADTVVKDLSLLQDRFMVDGKATAYVCHNFACDRPLNDPELLRKRLAILQKEQNS